MRVLHIGKYFPPFAGGMEVFLADLMAACQRQGVATAALVHAADRRTAGESRLADGARLFRAPTYGRLLYTPLSPAFPLWLGRAIRATQPDLLHLHLPNPSAFAALLVPAARRLPWVVHWHSDVVASRLDARIALAYRFYRPFEQRLLARSRAVIATSPPYLEASQALAPWRDRCHCVPLGLDPRRLPAPDAASLQTAARLWGGSKALRVIAVGRLTYYKGHQVLVEATAKLPDARVLIVGSGEQEDAITRRVRQLGLEQRLLLTGFQPDPVLHALLATADVLCLPSVERTEAFGLVLLEAMRFAKPVVVSDIPGAGTGWLVREAGHGLLVRPGDPADLTAAIARLQQDAALREGLGRAGSQALAARFGMDPVAAAVMALYRSLSQSPGATGPASRRDTPGQSASPAG